MAEADVDDEFVAVDGIVAFGEYGAAVAPTNATGDLDPTWTDLGLTADTGVTRAETMTSTVRRAWQKRRKLRTLITDGTVRKTMTLIQTNADTIEIFSGVPVVDGKVIVDPTREKPTIAWVDDTIDGDDTIREYIPRCRVVSVGDQVAIGSDSFGWPITIESEYDDEIGGHSVRWFSALENPASS